MSSVVYSSRSEVPEEYTWNLEDLFPSEEAWFAELEDLKNIPEKLSAYVGKLGESADTLLSYFKYSDEISERLMKLYSYASFLADEDAAVSRYQDMRGRAMAVYVAAGGADAFSAPEMMKISDETLEKFYEELPELKLYERALTLIRRRREHTLSAAEEKLLAAAGEMADAPDNIVSTFRNADLKYPEAADSEGNLHPVTAMSFVPLEESPDRELRKNAFESVYSTLGAYKNTVAATLDAQFKKLRFFSEARNYESTLQASLFCNEVPESVYSGLIEAVHGNLDKMHRYVSLRKRALGLDELHMYDVYAPMVPDSSLEIDFESAKKTVLEGLAVLGEDYTAILEEAFQNRWIDVYENKGKRSGAYSSDVGYPHPYVLLNHKDNLDSMFTLAHEMGHALHSWHSNKYQPLVYSNYVIFVAEVASTCNEVLLMRHLLSKTSAGPERAYLINYFLEQFKGTLYRQTMFAEFELEMGRMAEAGETLTAEALSEKYLALNKMYFGPDMVSDDYIAYEWARIPHFFYDYYVFQYATGFSAAVAIADRILKEGESAVRDYKAFLSSGCSEDPISLLKIAGADMSTPEPVNRALELFSELLDEMEECLG